MKGIFIASVLSFFMSLNVFAQNKKEINAQVVDSNTKEPVEFACVSNLSHSIGFMSDAKGCFSLTQEDILNSKEGSLKKSNKKTSDLVENDSLVISRVGYLPMRLAYDEVPQTIYLQPSLNTLQAVTVIPKKKKTLGNLYIPNVLQKKTFDLVSKYDFMHKVNHRIESELGRPFKLKNDSQINKIRVSIHDNDSVTVILNVYRKVDNDWISIQDEPIVVDVPASNDWRNVVEVDVSEILESQAKGEYLISLVKTGEGEFNLWARKPVTVDGLQRIVGTDKWKTVDSVPGIEIDIEY